MAGIRTDAKDFDITGATGVMAVDDIDMMLFAAGLGFGC